MESSIRQGTLPRSAQTSATRAESGDEHLARLQVTVVLADVRGLLISGVKRIPTLIDDLDRAPTFGISHQEAVAGSGTALPNPHSSHIPLRRR